MREFDSVTTRGGDNGESSLLSGERRRKDDLLFETLGDLDELSSAIGVARAALKKDKFFGILLSIQKQLLTGGAMLAAFPETAKGAVLLAEDVDGIEKLELKLLQKMKPQRSFIYPGDSLEGAYLDMARCICRRLERKIVSCIREKGFTSIIPLQHFINRLSDYLYIMARFLEENKTLLD